MRKSIIGNLVFYSFLTIGAMIIAISVYFTSHIETFAVNQKSKILLNNVTGIQQTTYFAYTNQSETMDVMLQSIIDSIAATTQSSVTVFDNNGVILTQSGVKSDPNSFQTVTDRVSSPVLRGEKITSINIYKDQYGEKILTVGAPLTHEGEIFGGVMFNQRVPEVKSVYAFVVNRTFVMLILAMILSVMLFGFLSFKITSPIRKISAAVKEFAKGNFKKRVEYDSDNEFGKLARNINDMASSLDSLESLRKRFISDVSHELRTPLTTISGFTEGILDGTIPEENRAEYLEVVLSESKRLSRLITNLLQVTKMDNGETKLEITKFDINELVRINLLKFEMMITPKNIDVSLNMDEEKIIVKADKDAITQVLTNLINNAVKFTPEGGEISINITRRKDKVIVEVENSGHGIEKEDILYIWDRFYKADKSRSDERNGMGLGLYIVKNLINMHGESITVSSEPDKKTVFTFTLPAANE